MLVLKDSEMQIIKKKIFSVSLRNILLKQVVSSPSRNDVVHLRSFTKNFWKRGIKGRVKAGECKQIKTCSSRAMPFRQEIFTPHYSRYLGVLLIFRFRNIGRVLWHLCSNQFVQVLNSASGVNSFRINWRSFSLILPIESLHRALLKKWDHSKF